MTIIMFLISTFLSNLLASEPTIQTYQSRTMELKTSIEVGIESIVAENQLLESICLDSKIKLEEVSKSFEGLIGQNLLVIDDKFEIKKDELSQSVLIDKNTLLVYQSLITALLHRLEQLDVEYSKSAANPTYRRFLVEQAKKLHADFERELASNYKLSRNLEEIISAAKGSQHRVNEYKKYVVRLIESPLEDALKTFIRIDNSCVDHGSLRFSWEDEYGNPNNPIKFDDPILWNFVISSQHKPITIYCKETRFGSPSVNYNRRNNSVMYITEYSVETFLFVSAGRSLNKPKVGVWRIIYDEAKKQNIN